MEHLSLHACWKQYNVFITCYRRVLRGVSSKFQPASSVVLRSAQAPQAPQALVPSGRGGTGRSRGSDGRRVVSASNARPSSEA